jgi:antitoxin component of RelBE/YafQ-DinJ toxin-antitoxin module
MMKNSLVQFRVSERLRAEMAATAVRKSMTVSELIRAAVRRQLEDA